MPEYPQVEFYGGHYDVVPDRYTSNDRLALEFRDPQTGVIVLKATVNVPNVELADNEIIIKDYNENEGVYDSLLQAKLVTDTGRRLQLGFVQAPVARLKFDFTPLLITYPETG